MLWTICILFILTFLGFQILYDSSSVMMSVITGIELWKNNIVPSMFPFFMLSEFFIYFGFVEFISEIFKPIMNKFFKMRGICSFIFIMSIFSGCPGNAKYTSELLNSDDIDYKEATKILLFSQFSSPLFILGSVANVFLQNKEVGFYILFFHYIGNLFVGICFRNYNPRYEKSSSSLSRAFSKTIEKRRKNEQSFGMFFTSAVQKAMQTLLTILGVIITFLVLTTIIDHNINIPTLYQSLLNGCLEMTQGLKYISLLSIPLKLKVTFTVLLLSFGGLSVHMQMFSILSSKVRYFPFLTARILHAFFSSFMAYIFFDFFF